MASSVEGSDAEWRVAPDPIEVTVCVEHRDVLADRDRRDETVELAARGEARAAASPVDGGGGFPVG